MRINADLSQRAFVDSNALPWVPSPLPGVERRMLERDGEEVARATSLVRYAPGSAFAAHAHGGGEEFLVLEGVFSDESGDYPAGYYVRNPVGSRHEPKSRPGCIILVKLRQMDAEDQDYRRVDTRDPEEWRRGRAGEWVLDLHIFGPERVSLHRLEAGAFLAEETFSGGAEYFVLEGAIDDAEGRYRKGCWLRLPAGSSQWVESPEGALFYRKTGHLSPLAKRG